MTTATLTERTDSTDRTDHHTKVLGNTRFYCIQPDCDGTHHVWCGCAH